MVLEDMARLETLGTPSDLTNFHHMKADLKMKVLAIKVSCQ